MERLEAPDGTRFVPPPPQATGGSEASTSAGSDSEVADPRGSPASPSTCTTLGSPSENGVCFVERHGRAAGNARKEGRNSSQGLQRQSRALAEGLFRMPVPETGLLGTASSSQSSDLPEIQDLERTLVQQQGVLMKMLAEDAAFIEARECKSPVLNNSPRAAPSMVSASSAPASSLFRGVGRVQDISPQTSSSSSSPRCLSVGYSMDPHRPLSAGDASNGAISTTSPSLGAPPSPWHMPHIASAVVERPFGENSSDDCSRPVRRGQQPKSPPLQSQPFVPEAAAAARGRFVSDAVAAVRGRDWKPAEVQQQRQCHVEIENSGKPPGRARSVEERRLGNSEDYQFFGVSLGTASVPVPRTQISGAASAGNITRHVPQSTKNTLGTSDPHSFQSDPGGFCWASMAQGHLQPPSQQSPRNIGPTAAVLRLLRTRESELGALQEQRQEDQKLIWKQQTEMAQLRKECSEAEQRLLNLEDRVAMQGQREESESRWLSRRCEALEAQLIAARQTEVALRQEGVHLRWQASSSSPALQAVAMESSSSSAMASTGNSGGLPAVPEGAEDDNRDGLTLRAATGAAVDPLRETCNRIGAEGSRISMEELRSLVRQLGSLIARSSDSPAASSSGSAMRNTTESTVLSRPLCGAHLGY